MTVRWKSWLFLDQIKFHVFSMISGYSMSCDRSGYILLNQMVSLHPRKIVVHNMFHNMKNKRSFIRFSSSRFIFLLLFKVFKVFFHMIIHFQGFQGQTVVIQGFQSPADTLITYTKSPKLSNYCIGYYNTQQTMKES